MLAINNELDVPVKFVGVGEQIDDLQPFDADAFAAGLFDKAPTEVDEEEIASFIGSAEAAADEKAEKGRKSKMKFILASNNQKKLAEMQRILSPLGIEVKTACHAGAGAAGCGGGRRHL